MGRHMFQTIVDFQNTIRFNLYEGQSLLARNCKHICEIVVDNLRSVPTGKITLEIEIEIDQNGVLNAYAIDTETRRELNVHVDINSTSYLKFKRDSHVISIDEKFDARHVERDETLATFLEDLDYFLDYLKKAYRNSIEQDKQLIEKKIMLAKRYISKNRLKIKMDDCMQLKKELEELIEKRRPINVGARQNVPHGSQKSSACSIL
jgi:molecular chaperone DnaK (HSP70)